MAWEGKLALTILVSLAIGLMAGVLLQRSDFCIAGMFRDLFLFRKTFMLRALLLLIVTSMMLFEGARHLELLRPYPFPLIGAPSLSNVAGGFLFGIGMVLAGGCVVGTLYRMGSGSVISAAAFGGLLAGSVLYAEFHPWWAGFKEKTTFFQGSITLPQLLGVSPLLLVAVVGLPLLGTLGFWWHRGALVRPAAIPGYLQPWKAAVGLAIAGLLSYVLIGMPMGITTAYTKWGAHLEQIIFPRHTDKLSYLSTVPLDHVQPLTGERLTGGPGPRWDAVAAIQYPLIIGIIAGSTLSAVLLGQFKIFARVPRRQLLSGLFGGLIMGLASRMAPSCNVWHLLGGIPLFALQSISFALGLVPGAWLGSRLLVKYVLPEQRL